MCKVFTSQVIACLLVIQGLISAAGCSRLHRVESAPIQVDSHYVPSDSVTKATAESLSQTFTSRPVERPQSRPLNMLVLSGGGQYAAYNAGLMQAWTERGDRPTFDVVTGISSGAILSVSGFLGPKYDDFQRELFTTANDRTLFTYHPVINLIRSHSLASSEKLEKIIEKRVTDSFMCELQQAHEQGRRLYIGTMNAHSRRLCVWDVGAIAVSGRPDAKELVRKVYLAAVSIPGVLPAVKFDVVVDGKHYVEEHVDGGPASQAFLRLCPGAERPDANATGWLQGSNLYVMAAGKLYPPTLQGRMGFIKRITSVISASLYALYRAEVLGMYAYCQVSGMKFHHSAIPEDADIPSNSTTFNTEAMKKMFAMGYEAMKNKSMTTPWRLTPPGFDPGEEEPPRHLLK